jgi:hypothetical protein
MLNNSRPIYEFSDIQDTGIYDIPVGGIVFYKNNSKLEAFIKESNNGLVSTSTLEDFLNDENLYIKFDIPVDKYLIETPVILNPTSNQVDFSGSFESTFYQNLETFDGIHEQSYWQVSTDINFSQANIINEEKFSNTYLREFPQRNIQPNTTYYVRVQYKSDDHLSRFSEPVMFTTGANYIESPFIYVDGYPDNVASGPKLTSSGFVPIGSAQTHDATSWAIYDLNGNIIWNSLNDTINLLEITIPFGTLESNTEYLFLVKYHGSINDSSRVGTRAKTSESFIQPPVLSCASAGNEGSNFKVIISNYNAAMTYFITATSGSVSRNDGVINWALPTVDEDKEESIFVYAEYNGERSSTTVKSIIVLDVDVAGDVALSIASFSNGEYNDEWRII